MLLAESKVGKSGLADGCTVHKSKSTTEARRRGEEEESFFGNSVPSAITRVSPSSSALKLRLPGCSSSGGWGRGFDCPTPLSRTNISCPWDGYGGRAGDGSRTGGRGGGRRGSTNRAEE